MRIKSKEEISINKEKFLIDYCKKMGWNHNDLTSAQILTIINQKAYKS